MRGICSATAWVAVLSLLLGAASVADARAPKRQRPMVALKRELADLKDQLAQLSARVESLPSDVAAWHEKLAAVEQRLNELAQAAEEPSAVADELDELRMELEELRDEAATRQDLRKYQRKPNEDEYRWRFAGEAEVRVSYLDVRKRTLRQLSAGLSQLTALPSTSPRALATITGIDKLAESLTRNDDVVRPSVLLRLDWENNRFFATAGYHLYAYAKPELFVYSFRHDVNRATWARDFVRPRSELGLAFKKAGVGMRAKDVALTVGLLQFTHGSGFFINPTNPFTPKDPLDPQREVEGVPAARLDWDLLKSEGATLSLQLSGVAIPPRNDLLDDAHGEPDLGGLGMLTLSTEWFTASGVGAYFAPDLLGRDAPAFGGIATITPLGMTLSLEALWARAHRSKKLLPELIASFEVFVSGLAPNGTTFIAEYYRNERLPATTEAFDRRLLRAVQEGKARLAVDQLTRWLGYREYGNIYIEPALTENLRASAAALVGLDGKGGLARLGFDYEFSVLTVHAYGGLTYGEETTQFDRSLAKHFAELGVRGAF